MGGDIKISLAEVELLTIRIRLIVCSLDKAREMGLDWWSDDAHLSPGEVGVGRTGRIAGAGASARAAVAGPGCARRCAGALVSPDAAGIDTSAKVLKAWRQGAVA